MAILWRKPSPFVEPPTPKKVWRFWRDLTPAEQAEAKRLAPYVDLPTMIAIDRVSKTPGICFTDGRITAVHCGFK